MKFVLCELTGTIPESSAHKKDECFSSLGLQSSGGNCNDCFFSMFKDAGVNRVQVDSTSKSCSCKCAAGNSDNNTLYLDEKTMKSILERFETKELAPRVSGGGYRDRRNKAPPKKEEPCTRPGCVHWKPPPPCVWDLPCKADCFETPAGIQPGRNPLGRGFGGDVIPNT